MDKITHDIRRQNWLSIITECQSRPEGMTVRQWLADNGISEKSYYYWIRKFRKETYDQMQPQVPVVCPPAEITFAEVPASMLPDVNATPANPVAILKSANYTIEITNDISERLLSQLLREVSHA